MTNKILSAESSFTFKKTSKYKWTVQLCQCLVKPDGLGSQNWKKIQGKVYFKKSLLDELMRNMDICMILM